MPESPLSDWLFDPLPTDFRRRGLEYRNMINCTFRGPVAHFTLNSQAELDGMSDLSDRSLFWLRFDRHVSCPADTWAFELPDELRTNKALLDWYDDAYKLEDTLWHFTHKVYAVVGKLSTPSEFAIAWPEVVAAVPGMVEPQAKLRAAARSPRNKQLRELVLNYLPLDPGGEMEQLTDMLASALMLQPGVRPNAWVGMLDKEIDL
jgi:hypothetical protein